MKKSYFDGGLAQLIGYYILGFLITVLTLGICLPWSFTMIWFLLTIITIGFYGFWVGIELRKWIVQHTYFE